MKKTTRFLTTTILILTLVFFGFSISRGGQTYDTTKLYSPGSKLSKLVSDHYSIEQVKVVTVGQECTYPDDVLVTMYIAKLADVNPIDVNKSRKESQSWAHIMAKLRIHPSRLFISVGTRSVPSNFSHAYAQYYKWKDNPHYQMTLYDKEIRNLVGLKFMIKQYNYPPLSAMRARQKSSSFTELILEKIF